MPALPEAVRRSWLDLRGPGVVAVSGGADSVALLRALATWASPLVVAHFNHRLRGAESDADERFVRELVGTLGLRCEVAGADIADEVRTAGENLEDVARRRRYDFLARVARSCGAEWVATGHTRDDQAETVLQRLLRGAGIQGLRGIASERELAPGVRLVRPLLNVSRAEVIAYLEELKQPWREDLSNRDPVFTRNRIRHELLPLLRTFNPSANEVLARLAEQAGEVHEEQEAAARALLAEAELPPARGLRVFRTDVLAAAPRHQVRGLFRLVWEREGWPLRDMTFKLWKRVVAVALGEETATDLPGGVRARRTGGVVQVGREND
jgi:tRNA(Ile)-lysidine synthase